LDEEVLAFCKLISKCIAANSIEIYINIMENQRASVNELLQIFREEKSSSICYLNCQMANIQYLQHVDNQTSRLHLEGDKDSDIPHLIKMLASPRPDGQQRVIFVKLSGYLKKEMLKAIKKVHIYADQKIVSKQKFRNFAPRPNLCHNHFISICMLMGPIWVFQTVRS
jgi:hypothetical protein